MKIKFDRSGGFANIKLSSEVNVNELPDDQAKELKKLVQAAEPFAQTSKNQPVSNLPDEFQYSLRFEDKDKTHTINTTDSEASESMYKLIEWLSSQAFDEKKKEIESKSKK